MPRTGIRPFVSCALLASAAGGSTAGRVHLCLNFALLELSGRKGGWHQRVSTASVSGAFSFPGGEGVGGGQEGQAPGVKIDQARVTMGNRNEVALLPYVPAWNLALGSHAATLLKDGARPPAGRQAGVILCA